MSRNRDRLVAIGVVALIGVLGVAVLLLLENARHRGVAALRSAQRDAVAATARSFNQRQAASLASTATLSQQAFTFELRGAKDQAFHDYLLGLVPEPTSGFFLVRADGIVTSGVLFTDPNQVGQPYQRDGFAKLISSDAFMKGTGGILAVGPGVTTAQPTSAYVLPILDRASGDLRGAFVYEVPIEADSDFSKEIGQLSSDPSQRWLFIDTGGVVIASSRQSDIATTIKERLLVTLPNGTHSADGRVIVVAKVPTSGWRLVFEQPAADFERELAGPLQTAGIVVVASTFILGAAMATMLVRRLRAAREEQRRLQALADSQEEFISIVSHELRTPVAGVVGFLETSLDHWDDMTDQERRHTLARATMNARRLQSLTRDVLEAETLERGAMTVMLDDVDLAAQVESAVESMREVAAASEIELEVVDTPTVRADSERLQQVLLNLLDNAVKHSPPDRPIRVVVRAADGGATVSVHDDGPGVDKETAASIFDKFVRGAGNSVQGTGLGLFICKRLVEAQGGRIWLEDGAEAGATFAFTLRSAAPPEAAA